MASATPRASARQSPYQEVVGDVLAALDPELRPYFDAIPVGHVGRGSGVFDTVGTPRRWLWPVLRALGGGDVVFGVWERDVRFTIENRPAVDANGCTTVVAARTFHFADGDRTMRDAITATDAGLVDFLGGQRRVISRLTAHERAGGLALESTEVGLRIAGVTVTFPRLVSPRVTLLERHDPATGDQVVSVVISAPVIGRLYEYSGRFRYAVVAEGDES